MKLLKETRLEKADRVKLWVAGGFCLGVGIATLVQRLPEYECSHWGYSFMCIGAGIVSSIIAWRSN